jgi:hypothetical protein
MATANRDTVPSLPALEPGITRIEPDERATGALASLVLDHAMVDGSPVRWVDSNGHARTGRLAFEVGKPRPSMRRSIGNGCSVRLRPSSRHWVATVRGPVVL